MTTLTLAQSFMDTAIVKYKGALRTESVHLASGESIISDAPVDNNGRGSAFSPTDALATSLATCMITVMAIAAEKRGLPDLIAQAHVKKVMQSAPRRVAAIRIRLEISGEHLDIDSKRILETVGKNCPVAKSLSTEIDQEITFNYY